MVEGEINSEMIETLRNRGLTCAKLKALENNERRDMQDAFKDAQRLRSFGFNQGADLKEKVGKAQEDLAKKYGSLRKRVCGLNK